MDRAVVAGAVLVAVIGATLFATMLATLPASTVPSDPTWIGEGLWEQRGLDLAVQALIVLAGVFGVLLVLGAATDEAEGAE